MDSFQTFLRHAVAALHKGDRQAHDIWLQAASHLFPTNPDSLDEMTPQLVAKGRGVEAETIARAFAALAPHDPRALFRLGLTLQLMNRHGDAVAPYRDALAIDPDLHSLRNNLASALMWMNPASAEAAELLTAALHQNPADTNAWVNLGKSQVSIAVRS
ncbi:hypothetical protein [Paraburkholderia steynii]|uniref:hypothetical protein n=1 Tax=Paraburkholderia steynii TaxID=1245441 RepID=UPI001FC9E31B|nr:hypothetical protein [Paraburkholderia steynii]